MHVCNLADADLADFRSAHPDHHASRCDVSDEDQVASLFGDVDRTMGGLDALVNNAGIAGLTAAVEDVTPADWRRTTDVGLTGQFLCTHFAVPMLIRTAEGAIVNMSSVAGRLGYPYRTPNAAAKWGVIGLTQSLAKELGPAGIRVNAVLPGPVAGPRMQGVIRERAAQLGITEEAMGREYTSRVSLRRMSDARDVAGVVLFLLGPGGRNVSGQSLGVDGNVEAL